jgi:hypothetical protein
VNTSGRGRRRQGGGRGGVDPEGEGIGVVGFVIVVYWFVNHTGSLLFLNSLGEAVGDVEVLGGRE